MNDELLFELMDLLENENDEEVLQEAIELLKGKPDVMEQVLENIAMDLLQQANERKPFVDAYKQYKSQKLKPLQ